MSKRKTREEKIKLSKNKTGGGLTYSYAGKKETGAIALSTKEIDYHKRELVTIIIAAAFIFVLNIALYLILTTGMLKLGLLGY